MHGKRRLPLVDYPEVNILSLSLSPKLVNIKIDFYDYCYAI